MNIHEYQAKELLQFYGVPVPEYRVIEDLSEVEGVIKDLKLKEAVLKIQVHAGGRGKAGGVKFAKTPDEIPKIAKQLLGMKICNNQTGPLGVIAHNVMIARPLDIEKEYYIGAVIDRQNGAPILIASPEGGMEIEEIAEKTPEKILKIRIPSSGILHTFDLWKVAKFMGWKNEALRLGMEVAAALAKAFIEKDGALLEINPLVLDKEGKIWALDAKFSIDDNALYRQKEIAGMYDPTQYTKGEASAKIHDLSYIALDGNIGCMVNGAGLAMATMDIIQYYGGKPANFLDVGGGASKEKVAEGFKIILSDPNVKVVFINIFGGIMNCGTLASGIIEAAKELHIKVPLVVRMEGTNVEQGKKILAESRLPIISADTLAEGAQKAVAALQP